MKKYGEERFESTPDLYIYGIKFYRKKLFYDFFDNGVEKSLRISESDFLIETKSERGIGGFTLNFFHDVIVIEDTNKLKTYIKLSEIKSIGINFIVKNKKYEVSDKLTNY